MTRFIRLPEVLARVSVSWITIYRWEREGRFPARKHLGPNTVAWDEEEVDEWCKQRSRAAQEPAHV
jgi:predicted DNA-binding transcriptional regulator AlpA